MTNFLSKLALALSTMFALAACGPTAAKVDEPLTCEEAGCPASEYPNLACRGILKPGETQTCICKADPEMPVECSRAAP